MRLGVRPEQGLRSAGRSSAASGRPAFWPSGRLEVVGLIFVLLAGAYLRLFSLEYGQFLYDDVTLWNITRNVAELPQILTNGMPSRFGIANGPFQAYLLLPGALTSPDPLGAYYAVAGWNILAIALLWGFARQYFGSRVAILAALLYALNPWAVVFSRRLWGNDLVAPFSVGLVWSLCDLVRHARRRDSILPLAWLAVVIQVYVVALVQLLVAAIGLLLGFRQLRGRFLTIGIGLFAILIAPYLLYSVWSARLELWRFLQASEGVSQLDFTSLIFSLRLVSSEGYQAFANQAGAIWDASAGLPAVSSRIVELLLALGVGVASVEGVKSWRQGASREKVGYILPVVAVVLPSLLLVRHSMPVYPYYLITGLPMHFLLAAIGARFLWRASGRIFGKWTAMPRAMLLGGFASSLAIWLILSQVFFTAIRDYSPNSEYGLPLKFTGDLARETRSLVDRFKVGQVYLGGSAVANGNLYLLLNRDLVNMTPFDSANTFVRPPLGSADSLYVVSSQTDKVGSALAQQLGDRRVGSVDVAGPEGLRYSLYQVSAIESSKLFAQQGTAVGVTFDGRVRLDALIAEQELMPGRDAEIALRWTLLADQSANLPTYYAYVRLMDQEKEVVHGQDSVFHGVGKWQKGEEIITWRSLPVPARLEPGVYSYLIGLYEMMPTSYRNAIAADAQGARIGEGVRVGKLVVRGLEAAQAEHPLAVDFGQVRLEGYDLVQTASALDITLSWRSLHKLEQDYTVFVHLLGSDGQVVAQHDGPPMNGRYPTGIWLQGDTLRDTHSIALPPGPKGKYLVEAGLYDPANGQRLGGEGFAATFEVDVR